MYMPVSYTHLGEIVLPISKFESLNERRMEAGEEVFANPRNAASGTLRQIDASIIKERGLDCYFYFIVDAKNYGIQTLSLIHILIGFPVKEWLSLVLL